MRIIVWATLSLICLWFALRLFFAHLPFVGGGSIPYDSYTPLGALPMLYSTLVLFLVYVLFLWRRAHSATWFFCVIASFLPVLLSAWPSWYDLRSAENDELHAWEGSDVWGHIQAAKTNWVLGCIFTGLLLNMCVFGFLARRRSNQALEPTAGRRTEKLKDEL